MKTNGLVSIPERVCPQFDYPVKTMGYTGYPRDYHRFCYIADIHDVSGKQLLVLDIFRQFAVANGQADAVYRVYLNQDDYITRVYERGLYEKAEWITGAVENLREIWGYALADTLVPRDDDSLAAIHQFYGWDPETKQALYQCKKGPWEKDWRPEGGIELVRHHQRAILAARLEKKRQRIRDSVDAVMAKVPPLPEGFMGWLEDDALHRNYLIAEPKNGSKPRSAYCNRCRSFVDIKSMAVKHNDDSYCPACGVKGQWKSEGLVRKKQSDEAFVAVVLQTADGGLVIRHMKVLKYFDGRTDRKVVINEHGRTMYDRNGRCTAYSWESAFNNSETRWMPCGQGNSPEWLCDICYTKNFPDVFRGTLLEYVFSSGIVDMNHKRDWYGRTCLSTIIARLFKYPQIESLVKIGMNRLAKDMTQSGRIAVVEGNKLHQQLLVDKPYFDYMRQHNLGEEYLRSFQKVKKAGRFITVQDAAALHKKAASNFDQLLSLAGSHTVRKILEFWNATPDRERPDYVDYLRMAKQLDYDLRSDFVAFPRHIKQVHDQATERINAISKGMEDGNYRKLVKGYAKRFSYSDDNFMIIVPKHTSEICKEGHDLHHCVGSYVLNVVSGEKVILFVRKASQPEKPFYTMEVNPVTLSIVQCRGNLNRDMPADVKEFIAAFDAAVLRGGEKARSRKAG